MIVYIADPTLSEIHRYDLPCRKEETFDLPCTQGIEFNTTVSEEQGPSTGVRGRNENAVVAEVEGNAGKDPQ